MRKSLESFDVIVVGGGASGMMSAGIAASRGKKVLLLEKNKFLGEKLKITGGGRCNITNAEFDIHALLKNYGDGAKFLYSPFAQFGVKDTFSFFESRGLPIVVQARKRAFPQTERSIDVFNVMEKFIREHKVVVKTDSQVNQIKAQNGAVQAVMVGSTEYTAKSFIIATGGLSHPETGSTGDGFKWLEKIGHTTQAPTPTIVPLRVQEKWVKDLSGTSLSFMKITFFVDGVKKFSKTGKVLFTHFGLSGPLILNSASKVSELLKEGVVTATIDAYPDTDLGPLEEKIIKIFDANKNKMLKNILIECVPDGMSEAILSLLKDIQGDTKVHSVTKDERKVLVRLLKALPLTITGLMGYDRAVVADGGVTLKEIDTKTMRSTLYKNLFITGDLLHINRPSGGFSLQLCWTTGYVAGLNA